MKSCKPYWSVTVNAKVVREAGDSPEAAEVASMFGLHGERVEQLYERFKLRIEPGQIVAVVGPSGGGKSVLLREVASAVADSRWLRTAVLAKSLSPAVAALKGGSLRQRLAMLSRCGLADATALVTPARNLSDGQLYRLALADALHTARRRGKATLVIADEFAASLDFVTAANLCRGIRRLIARSDVALLLATPRAELLASLAPDNVVVKPIDEDARLLEGCLPGVGLAPRCWPIERGRLADYKELGRFHYITGPPAAHKRVYVIRAPARFARFGGPAIVAVAVVSPPLPMVRGRNIATAGRYGGPDRSVAMALLNAEVEAISRVIVHPMYRGCGLAVRLVRHVLSTAERPVVEALAVMGAVHPFFEMAGMRAWPMEADIHTARLLSAAESVGLNGCDVAAVTPVRGLLAGGGKSAELLKSEIDLCIKKTFSAKQLKSPADPLAEMCRRTARQYVYFIAYCEVENTKCPKTAGSEK